MFFPILWKENCLPDLERVYESCNIAQYALSFLKLHSDEMELKINICNLIFYEHTKLAILALAAFLHDNEQECVSVEIVPAT